MSEKNRLSILLIEDNKGDARLIEVALAGMPDAAVEVTWAPRLSAGLEHLAAGGIDVVLLDLSLPDSRGLETFLRVHEHSAGVPVVVLSGLQDEELAVEAVQKGAQDYLNKTSVSVDSNMLVRSIRYAIERKRVQQELARLASFPERNPYPVIETNAEGKVTYCNPAALAHFPDLETRAPRHPIVDNLGALFPEQQNPPRGTRAREVEVSGKVYEQHLSFLPESGHIRSYIIDITERKQFENLKDDFMSTVSHELRTPLSTIQQFVNIISDQLAGPVTGAQQEYFRIIKGNIERFARIINDLLDMAKIEAGHIVIRKEYLDLPTLLNEITQSMTPLAAPKRIELVLNAADALPELFADGDKVTQILTNLIDNAIKFVKGPGRVTVSVEDRPREIRFSVSDTGVGIPEEDLPLLFEKYRQARPTLIKDRPKGTGLGLAISRRLVELHHGRIWATSQPGQGSTFCFTMPKYEMEEVLGEYLTARLDQVKRRRNHFSVILLSVDQYGALRARHGAAAVSRLLKDLEAEVWETARSNPLDMVIPWKDGKMIAALETGKSAAQNVAAHLKQHLGEQVFTVGTVALSPSLRTATATFPDEAASAKELLQLMERAN